ncbi:MAG: SGNH/GDSL hydrolase family protein [Lachnospiraceae bacterium]|nr:SGNH/GDSL hydrolase family protein [Lachnospiraceae bacterium]
MKIEEIDKNLLVNTKIAEPDIIWMNIRQIPFVISGIQYDEEQGFYTRMPQAVAEQVSAGVAHLNSNTAGGRVRFRTNSSFIGIHAVMNNCALMPHITLVGQSGFDLYRKKEGENTEVYYHSFIPPMDMQTGYSAPFETDGALAEYTINFPLYDGVKELYIALKKDAVLLEPTPYRHPVPIVYYGSSITQGGCASSPGNSYQAIISRMLDTDYINLGFSGSGKAEDKMVQYLSDLKMSVFVCDYDHNTPDAEYLLKTHLPLYRSIRAKQPELPIIFLSAPDILIAPQKFSARREVVRNTYQTALDEGDKNVYYIDGAELFAGDNWDSCTVDGTHPNDLGFYRMAMRINKEIQKIFS